MSNRVKEGCWVVILTVLHAIFTVLVLREMPFIVFYHMRASALVALGLWTAYVAGMYIVTLVFEGKKAIAGKDVYKAIGVGLLMAILKGIIDTVWDRAGALYTDQGRYIVLEIQGQVLLFGIILFVVLQIIVARKRIVFDLKKAMAPVVAMAIVLVVYIVQVCNNLGDYTAYKHYATTEVQLYNLDMYITHKILNHNIWSYVLLYICFWWFMQRITVSKEIKDSMTKKR